jgi:hypothetical protein
MESQVPWLAVSMCLLSSLLSGCVGLESFVANKEDMPTGKACQIAVFWNKEIAYAADTVNGGVETPGLVGRVYLFGPKFDFPLIGNGTVTVELYKGELPEGAGAQVTYQLAEKWQIDKDTLKRLARKDTIGWGYTLFLPWSSYKAETRLVRLKVRYDSGDGSLPLYTEAPLSLARQGR